MAQVFSVDELIETERLSENCWMAWHATLEIDAFGTTEDEASLALVPKFVAALDAMSEEDRNAWVAANATFEPHPPMDPAACAVVLGAGNAPPPFSLS